MFTYLDPDVRSALVASGKLICIDGQGRELPSDRSPTSATHMMNLLGPVPLPRAGKDGRARDARWYAAVRRTELSKLENLASELREQAAERLFAFLASSLSVNSVLLFGDPGQWDNPMVRVHSNCQTGEVFGSLRCECGPQLDLAIERIEAEPQGGMLIYMSGHEGRGIGLWAKAATYVLQDSGQNTYQANRSLGLPDDCRDFTDAGALIHYFVGNRPFRLLTNNPKKISDLREHGLTEFEPVRHLTGISGWNKRYLAAKRDWGHDIGEIVEEEQR